MTREFPAACEASGIVVSFICLAPGDFSVNRPLVDEFTIEIDRWPRPEGPLANHIEVFRMRGEIREGGFSAARSDEVTPR